MGGGIRMNVKGYVVKRVTLDYVGKVHEDIENETIYSHMSTTPQAADCVEKKPEDPSSIPETSMVMDKIPHTPSLSSTLKLECMEKPESEKWSEGMDPALLDDIIGRLEFKSARPCIDLVSESEMTQLCHWSAEIFLSQPNVLDLKSPIHIIGDEFTDLSTNLNSWGFTTKKNVKKTLSTNLLAYVFLGDFKARSSDTICLLLAYKIKYPNNVFLLRGDHGFATNQRHGFYDRRHTVRLWEVFNDCFNCIPSAAIVDDRFIKLTI